MFIKRLFISSLLSAIRVVSSVYLRLLIFLPAILIPACASSSPVFLMMYSAYKLNKQGDNIQPWRIPFPIWNKSLVPCPVLTVASWPAYRFLKRQIRWSGIPNSWRISHSLLWYTVKDFGTERLHKFHKLSRGSGGEGLVLESTFNPYSMLPLQFKNKSRGVDLARFPPLTPLSLLSPPVTLSSHPSPL